VRSLLQLAHFRELHSPSCLDDFFSTMANCLLYFLRHLTVAGVGLVTALEQLRHAAIFACGPGAARGRHLMFRWYRARLLAALGLALASTIACRRHASDETYFLISTNLQIPYWQQAGAGFAAAAAQLKVQAKFVGPQNYDLRAEQEALRQAIREKPAGILIHVADSSLLLYDINHAVESGIPVVTIDADAPASKRLFFIGTNNRQVGWLGGQRLAQELKEKGNVIFFTMPEQTNLADRLRGYREALLRYPQIRVVRVVDIAGNAHAAFDTVNNILATQSDQFDAFVCLESQSGREVASALNQHQVHGKVVMAMDTDPETLELVRQGVIAATIAQKPYTMAVVGLRMLDDLHHYRPAHLDTQWSKDNFAPVPAFVDTGSTLVDKDNAAIFRARH
jgi:ribose transport system substrate-binding protein